MSQRTLVGFAGASVEVVRRDAGATELADFIFRHFVRNATAPCLQLELAQDGPSTYALWREGSEVYRHTPAAAAARLLLAEVIHSLALACCDQILLHAAGVVVPPHRGVLLPAPSGAGKSTLAAWLDAQGFACLSDELIGVAGGDTDDAHLIAFPRPICLERSARDVMPDIVERARRDGRLLEVEDALLLAVRSPVPPSPVPLERIVFPRYDASAARTACEPLSKAEAGLRLMACLTYAQGLPEHGFAAVSDLARRVPAFELSYGRLEGITGGHPVFS
jgi:hypothetical protein